MIDCPLCKTTAPTLYDFVHHILDWHPNTFEQTDKPDYGPRWKICPACRKNVFDISTHAIRNHTPQDFVDSLHASILGIDPEEKK